MQNHGVTFAMTKPYLLLPGILLALTGCAHSGYDIGADRTTEPSGSYSGATLNSPVTDQNSHVGGDSSYPASVSDQGVQPKPVEK